MAGIPDGKNASNPDQGQLSSAAMEMELDKVSKFLLLFGGGYVVREQPQLFARFGLQVTMLVRSRLASAKGSEAFRTLMGVFADEGIPVVRRAACDVTGPVNSSTSQPPTPP